MKTTTPATSARWSSRLSFVLAATAAAVGLGNIWKFPYIMGENGGGAFVLVYLVCIFALGIPVLIGELLIGRRGRHSPGYAARALAKESARHPAWQLTGWGTMLAGFMILTFYVVVASWAFSYVFKSASGVFNAPSAELVNGTFATMTSSSTEMLWFTGLLVLATALVVGKGLNKGLERTVKWLMPLLLLLMIGLAVYASQVGDFAAAVDFIFRPDFSQLTVSSVLIALGHAFFTLSLASGVMIMYGAYLPKETSIVSTSIWIGIADTLVALIAGLAIFPLVFGYGLPPGEGPGLIFQTLPLAFATMPGGQVVATFFFVMLLLAAFTSAISMIESIAAFVCERFNVSRWQAAAGSCVLLFTLSLMTIYSFAGAAWAQVDWAFLGKETPTLFHVIDHLTSNVMLPLGGLAVAVFTGWMLTPASMRDELATSLTVFRLWQFAVRFVAPVAIGLVFLQLIGLL